MATPVTPNTAWLDAPPRSALLPAWVRTPLSRTRGLLYRCGQRFMYAVAGDRVVAGPFQGMHLPIRRDWPPYVLGSQELELHEAIERLVQQGFDQVVNVGAGVGYYTVGLALRMPAAGIIAFEADPVARTKVEAVARANGVSDRVTLRGACTADMLDETLRDRPGSLLVIDIEGGEVDILDPLRSPGLRTATILVETHDILRPGCAAAVKRRFAATHDMERIRSRPRTPDDLPAGFLPWLKVIAPRMVRMSLNEWRGSMQEWILLRPRTRA